jgi:hypothetical protein
MMKPTKQYDDRESDASRDLSGSGSFSMYALERMLRDCTEQPEWRLRASIASAYYDGKQLTEEQKFHIRQEGLEERAINLIRPVINSVLGQEAKSRTSVKVEADDDQHADVAEVISAKLKEAERETCAHMAVSEAYSSMVKKGLGWVHVSKTSDPLDYAYRVESVPIEEVWWDWHGQRGPTLLNGCRWLVRKRFVDLDEIQASMPRFKDVLSRSVLGWSDYLDNMGNFLGEPENVHLVAAFENERRFSLAVNRRDWIDGARKMIALFEVWYRVPAEVAVLHLGTRKVPYNDKDPRHIQAVSRGLVKVTKGITSQVRRALYAGPHRLLDEGTTKRNFPYYPFFAFRDDFDKSPYGLIDGMIAPQDEYNERRLRVQWMLKARQVEMDSDALDAKFNKLSEITDAIMRPDLVVITNPNRMNKNQSAVKIRNDLSMQPEQFNVMADSKQLIQDTSGRFNTQLGSAQVQSGIANSILVEQGEQSMGEMNDNYVYGRRSVFEGLVNEIISDYRDEKIQVPIGSGKARRIVVLNDWDPQGMPVNRVDDAVINTGLAETPNTPAYRQQTQQNIATIIQALGNNPQAVAILAPAFIESTSLTDRAEVADSLRKASGLPTPGDKNGQAQADAMQQQQLQQKMQQEQAAAAAKVDVDVANAERHRAAAKLAEQQAELVSQKVRAGAGAAEVDEIVARTESLEHQNEPDEDELIEKAMQDALA